MDHLPGSPPSRSNSHIHLRGKQRWESLISTSKLAILSLCDYSMSDPTLIRSNGWKYEAMTYKYICFVSRGNGRMPGVYSLLVSFLCSPDTKNLLIEIQETPYADRGNKPHESPMTQAIHEGGYEVPSDHPLGPGAQ